jgi:hypothetical protein
LGALIALGAFAAGALLAFAGPLITVGILLAALVAVWSLTSLEVGLWASIGIVTLLPFAALPFKVVLTPTFLDLALGGAILVYGLQWMSGRRRRLVLTPAHGPLGIFLALAIISFVAGMPNGPTTTNLMRQFAELLLNIGLSFIIVDYVDDWTKLGRLARIILFGGVTAAVLGIGLYLLPAAFANRALSALAPFGYPGGNVLRYVEDNPANAQRAIATLGGPQLFRRPAGDGWRIAGAATADSPAAAALAGAGLWRIWSCAGMPRADLFSRGYGGPGAGSGRHRAAALSPAGAAYAARHRLATHPAGRARLRAAFCAGHSGPGSRHPDAVW